MLDTSRSIIQRVSVPYGDSHSFFIDVKRDDLIDPVVSGNKWRKLKYNVLKAKELGKKGILTFGGAYSNHLVATARACQLLGLQAIGLVRGEELNAQSNLTLQACTEYGMQLLFKPRSLFRNRYNPDFFTQLSKEYPDYFIVAEGGRGVLGLMGCQEIVQETPDNYTDIYLAAGTGTTAAGVLLESNSNTRIHVISALKGNFLEKDIRSMISEALGLENVDTYMSRLIIEEDAHFGKFAHVTPELLNFINLIYDVDGLPLDPIYTSKAFYQLKIDIENTQIGIDDNVLFIHTGGLQGALPWSNQLNYIMQKAVSVGNDFLR
ncbi:MAG: pyridoxal-phosphate dependent enzyme [Brumimicrobium sp.]|nr:pyridoxal-phosphate dependent enzyme [Brumimicrobium sp.]